MVDVPLFASSLAPYHDRLSEALDRVARSGRYILGPEVEAFEEEFAGYLGVRHCIGVANGTDALTIALKALGVGPGDEVVMPSFTCYATSACRWWRTRRRRSARRWAAPRPGRSATPRRSPSSPRRTFPAWATAGRSSPTTPSSRS